MNGGRLQTNSALTLDFFLPTNARIAALEDKHLLNYYFLLPQDSHLRALQSDLRQWHSTNAQNLVRNPVHPIRPTFAIAMGGVWCLWPVWGLISLAEEDAQSQRKFNSSRQQLYFSLFRPKPLHHSEMEDAFLMAFVNSASSNTFGLKERTESEPDFESIS